MRLARRLRNEDGLTLVELAVASLVLLVALGLVGSALTTGLRTSNFATRQSSALDSARHVLHQVARDLRGSRAFSMPCSPSEPAGSCALLLVQTPSGADRHVRLRLDGTTLYREVDDGTGTFPAREVLSDRIANLDASPAERLFSCSTAGARLLQVQVHMLVQPDPANEPRFVLDTGVRPRNTYAPPSC